MKMEKTNVRVDFRITGDTFSTSEITRQIGVNPTQTWNVGDPVRSSGKKRLYTGWLYSTDGIETMNVNQQFCKIEEIFAPKLNMLCELKAKLDLTYWIDIIIRIENHEAPAIYFEPRNIQLIAKLEANLDIDTYINEQEQ